MNDHEASMPDFDAWLDVERLTGRTPVASGRVAVPGGEAWWMRVGSGPGTPLLTLHGGPGSGHDGLLPLAALADDRAVIFYDQLGCGRSDSPACDGVYSIQRAVDEVDAIREALDLHTIDLFGQSWGTVLAIELLCQRRGTGIRRLVLSGAVASMPQFTAGAKVMADAIRQESEAAGAASPEDQDSEVERIFTARHFCRVQPEPANLSRSADNLKRSIAYRVMNGPNEFTVTGVVRDWDRSGDLHTITVPTLVTTGEYDEVAADVIDTVVTGISGARRLVFPGCSHSVLNEAPGDYLQAIRAFLC